MSGGKDPWFFSNKIMEIVYPSKKESMSLEGNQILSRFDRNEFNCGAIQLSQSTGDLFTFIKTRHLNFFEAMIQANIRKEAKISLIFLWQLFDSGQTKRLKNSWIWKLESSCTVI